jgi:hypothetical protein
MEQRMITNLPGLKVATVDPQIGSLKKIVLLVFLLASASSAEGQTTPLPASKDTLSISEQIKAEWARADREAEKATPSFREQKADWARANKDAEKHGLSFREQKADWARANKDAENGPKDRPWDRDADGNRPWNRKDAPPQKE